MQRNFFTSASLPPSVRILVLLLFCVTAGPAQSGATAKGTLTRASSRVSSEQRTAHYFESVRKSPPQQLAFLLKMPKGGDLHNHLSGAIYAESYVSWAIENELCVDIKTMVLSPPPPTHCDRDSQEPPVSTAVMT
ncbi:MAG: hypothetical protein ABJC05_05275, partial [Pyrinomonadaceae bacterium]